MNNRMRDELSIREVERAYDHAWAASDIAALGDCYTADAVVVNPRGEVARGVEQIREIFGAFLRGPAQGSIHESRIVRIEFVTNDVAVVDGEASIHNPAKPDEPAITHQFTDVLARKQGAWRIAHVRAYGLNDRQEEDNNAAQQDAPADHAARRG